MSPGVVIVGSGLAGYGLARELRKLDAEVGITVLTRDGGEQYAKPNLSAALTAGHDPQRLVQAEAAGVAQKLGITVRAGTPVTGIDPSVQVVHTDAGDVPYRDLVLAVGANPARPPFVTDAALASGRVRQVNDLEDYRLWRAQLTQTKSVVVIGAGLIGIEFASDLRHAGYAVQVVDFAPQVLGRLLPTTAANFLQARLEASGIRFALGQGVAALTADANEATVTVTDGTQFKADLVLVAIGLAPRLELARDAGILTTRTIPVDALLQTSAAHVYALGDCAEVSGQWLPFVAPLLAGARSLAQTLAGTPTPLVYGPMPVIVKTPACPTIVLPPPAGAVWTTQDMTDGVRALAVDDAGLLCGFALLGAAASERAQWLKTLGTAPSHP